MKILVMGNNDESGGGLIVHYKTLADYLRKAGFELMFINVNDNQKNKFLFSDKKIVETHISFKPKTVFQKIQKYLQLQNAIKKAKIFKPDIFVATGLGYGYASIANALPAKVFTLFEEVHFEATADSLRKKMVQSFDAVATQTKGMIAGFKKNVSDQKPVAALPCFSKEYTNTKFENLPEVNSEIRLAYFGRLAWNKGVRQFVEATKEIFYKENLRFNVYGRGNEFDAIHKEIGESKLQHQIKLKGFYNDDEFAALINSYHGIIIPSIDTEGLPLVLIEAMRFGRPVLATTTGAMPEVAQINNKGMLITEKDPASLAKNLSTFIESIRAGKYDAAQINMIYKEKFSNEVFFKVWLQMFDNPEKFFAEKNLA